LADWLKACGVDTVAMESTGVYWIPLYEILDRRGFKLYLVSPQYLKRVPGRKTDVEDCQWLQQLHTFGLLSAQVVGASKMYLATTSYNMMNIMGKIVRDKPIPGLSLIESTIFINLSQNI
jgi:hypothetical protein